MALVETLIAAAIIALVAGLFLGVLVQGSDDIGRSRGRTQALMVADTELRRAAAEWPVTPRSGTQAGYQWTLTCPPTTVSSPRLALIRCTVTVSKPGLLGAQPLRLTSAWTALRNPPSPP